jgi:CRISPR system Cascade subunit CasE
MHLSRLRLRAKASRAPTARRLVEAVTDSHRLVWSFFEDGSDRRRDFLYRQEGVGSKVCFFTLSERLPQDPLGLWDIESKLFEPRLQRGERLQFCVRVNPTFRRAAPGEGYRRRHDVVMDAKRRLREQGIAPAERPREAELVQRFGVSWLAARAERHGFSFRNDDEHQDVRVDAYQRLRFHRGGRERDLRISTVDLSGLLTVEGPEAFMRCLTTGLGPAKGFGCGLMLVRRPSRVFRSDPTSFHQARSPRPWG